jgi:hypothetical protein
MKRRGELAVDTTHKRARQLRVTLEDILDALDHLPFDHVAAIHAKTSAIFGDYCNELASGVHLFIAT